MKRREYLERIGAASSLGIASLAGCGAPGGGGAATPGAAETPTETQTATAAETGTPAGTETATETPTLEATQTPANGTAGGGGTQTGTPGGGAPNEVAMITEGSNYLFDPIGLFVEPGETITWVIQSGAHSSTSYSSGNPAAQVSRIPSDAQGWNSGTLTGQGTEFTHTFDVEGTYDYYCIPHKTLGMVARIVVGEPSGLGGNPPDGPVPSEQRIVQEGAVTQQAFNP